MKNRRPENAEIQNGIANGCDLCGSADQLNFPRFISRPLTVVICRRCGLIYTNPGWSEAEIGKIYETEFRDDPGAPLNCRRENLSEYRAERFNRAEIQAKTYLLPMIEKFIDPKNRRWLEVRFRAGALPVELSARGAEVYGVDLFAANVEWLQSKLPEAKIYRRDVHNLLELEAGNFDAITMLTTHVAAHVPSPTALFRAAFEKLAGGGMIFIDEKDITHSSPTAALFPFQHPYGIAHYHHLTLRTLKLFLEKVGFEILHADYTEKYSAQRHFLIVARKPFAGAAEHSAPGFEKSSYKRVYAALLRDYLFIRSRQAKRAALKKLKISAAFGKANSMRFNKSFEKFK